jgi:hypothetical protein
MQRLGIQTGADLRTKSLAFLQQHFGTVTVRPKALALSHQAQTSSAHGLDPGLDFGGRDQVALEGGLGAGGFARTIGNDRAVVLAVPRTGRSSWPFAIPRYQAADFPKCCCRKVSDFVLRSAPV